MRVTIRHGGVVKCDVPSCREQFTTYSVASKAREQAANDGWQRVKLGSITGSAKWGLGGPAVKVDVCPKCKVKPRMTRAD